MAKYSVTGAIPVYVTVVVDADSADEAIEKAADDMALSNFCGNGGTDKLCGVTGSNVSVEPGEEVMEFGGFAIEATEI